MIILSLTATNLYKKDLYGPNLTSGAGTYIKNNIEKFSRALNTENIGGALIYHAMMRRSKWVHNRANHFQVGAPIVGAQKGASLVQFL